MSNILHSLSNELNTDDDEYEKKQCARTLTQTFSEMFLNKD